MIAGLPAGISRIPLLRLTVGRFGSIFSPWDVSVSDSQTFGRIYCCDMPIHTVVNKIVTVSRIVVTFDVAMELWEPFFIPKKAKALCEFLLDHWIVKCSQYTPTSDQGGTITE